MFWNYTAESKAADSRTELMEAAMNGKVHDLRRLLAGMGQGEINSTVDVNGANALFYAASHGHAECIDTLIAAGADAMAGMALVCIYDDMDEPYVREDDEEWDVDERDRFAPIHAAVFGEHAGALKSLIEGGADTSQPTAGDILLSPISLAAEVNSLEMVKLLIEMGASVNISDPMSKQPTPLCAALGSEASFDIVRTLLDAGADPNEHTWWLHGYTAMHMAARGGNRQALKLLLDHGGNSNAVCQQGFYPLHVTLADNCTNLRMLECQRYLCSLPGAPLESALWLALLNCSARAAIILVSSRADVNMKARFEDAALSPKLKVGMCALDLVKRLPYEWQDGIYYEENRQWFIFMHACAVGRRCIEIVAMRSRAIENESVTEEDCAGMLGDFAALPTDLISIISTFVFEPPAAELPADTSVLPPHRRRMLYCMRDEQYPPLWEIADYETPSSEDEHGNYEERAEEYDPTRLVY